MYTVQVELGSNRYPIYIGAGLLSEPDLLTRHIQGRQVMIVSNSTVADVYLDNLIGSLEKTGQFQVDSVILPDGEAFKTLETLDLIFTALLDKGHHRGTTLIALGGGVVGDMTGFAAACFQRGVSFIQIPTSLLAQVDASVGGKTAVNHALGKNMIGAFHQPSAVIIDTLTLESLPQRELRAGIAEIIKHGILAGSEFFGWLESNMDDLLGIDPSKMALAIRRNCEIKAGVVAQDEREQGVRALLNLGHTFGHAIESALGYGKWVHGEAVATGLVMAADLSVRLNMLDSDEARRVKSLVARAGLPVQPPAEVSPGIMLSLMARDKKANDSGMRFVLIDSMGQCEIRSDISEKPIRETLKAGRDLCL